MLPNVLAILSLSIWIPFSFATAEKLSSEKQVDDLFYQTNYPLIQPGSSVVPLHVAAAWGQINVLQMLLATGSNTDQVDTNGNTALLYAVQEGHVEIVKMLLLAGADPAVENRFGASAISLAAGHGHRAILEELGKKPSREKSGSLSNLWLWVIALLTGAGISTATFRRFTGMGCDPAHRIEKIKRAFA